MGILENKDTVSDDYVKEFMKHNTQPPKHMKVIAFPNVNYDLYGYKNDKSDILYEVITSDKKNW